jgi:iron complex outermembrane receptor protein
MSVKAVFPLCFLLLCRSPAGCQDAEAAAGGEAAGWEEYVLPEAEITAERDTPETVTREEMDRDRAKDLWEAVEYVPGVILSGGGRRNESNFSIRGFGPDSVPVYVDGIPLSSPYRGEGDSARLLIGDMESVEIRKGFSTELLGANTLGGAVLLRTGKPKEPFEASLASEAELDSVGRYAGMSHTLNLGTRQKFFYLRGVAQYRGVDHFRLSSSFAPDLARNPQESGDRLWSDSKDAKGTLMGGWTPGEGIELWLSYTYQWSDKGVSPPEIRTTDYAIWDWPIWKRHSISLNGDFSLGNFNLMTLLYFDKYDNRMDEYPSLAAWKRGRHLPHSNYDEYSLGGRVVAGYDFGIWGMLQAALTYKKDDHLSLRGNRSNDLMTEETHVAEDIWSLGMEYAFQPWNPLTVKAGFGFNALVPLEYWNEENEFLKELEEALQEPNYFIVKSRSMFLYTWQAGFFYRPWEDHEFRLTYARKNHFPSMAQRYSTRFGRTLPNPGLGPEQADHVELGYNGYFAGMLSLSAALYYSRIRGKITTVQWPNPHISYAQVNYDRNLDSTSFWGAEFSPELTIGDWLSAGCALSLNAYTINKSQTGIEVLSYYPLFTANSYLVFTIFKSLRITPRVEYVGSRYADTEKINKLEGYFLANISLRYDLGKHFSFSFGVKNIFDAYYEISYNYPMAGRSFNFSLAARY